MTGRKGRVVRDGRGHGVYELRAKPDSADMDSLNVREAGAAAELLVSYLLLLAQYCCEPRTTHVPGQLVLALCLCIATH